MSKAHSRCRSGVVLAALLLPAWGCSSSSSTVAPPEGDANAFDAASPFGQMRSDGESCGICTAPETCGGGGDPNVCGVVDRIDSGRDASKPASDAASDAPKRTEDAASDAPKQAEDAASDASKPEADSGTTRCTVTVSSVSAINADLTAGAIVCLAAGTYGALSLTANPSSNATLTAAPGAHVVVDGVTISGSNLTVSQLYSTNTILLVPPAKHDVVDHNDVTSSPGGYGIQLACNTAATQPGCSYITFNGNRVHDLSSTVDSDGDALRLDGWANVTVTSNEVFHIEQQPGSDQGHTDCLQSYNAGVSTHDLVFANNYLHDNQCEGPPFLKDGDVSTNVTITDNLSVRGANLNSDDTALFFDENTTNAIIRNNTFQDTNGSVLEAGGTTANPKVTADHNVFDEFNISDYALVESYNVFTGGNQWSFTLNVNDLPQGPYGTTYSPKFKCGSGCGNGTTAGDDYRLATNPNGIGIDWAPAAVAFGPTE